MRIDQNTFLTTLYVMCDDFCKAYLPAEPLPAGRPASLSRSEIITLAVFSQWYSFRNQRDFYRQHVKLLRAAFPSLPSRPQLNRLIRAQQDTLTAFSLDLVERLQARSSVYEILDTTGVPVRNIKRRNRGWLAGEANIGWCTRLGWFNGFRLIIATAPNGVITGFAFGSASAKEQPLTEVFLSLRAYPNPRFQSVGQPARGYYVGDRGFAGLPNHQRWQAWFGAQMICEPQANAQPWPSDWQRWLRHYRQVVETVFHRLIDFFRLTKERPHHISGFRVLLAAKVALHNFCIWLNLQFGRPALAFADLINWWN